MIKKIILILICFLVSSPSNCFAIRKTIKKDGYKINLEWDQVVNKLKISGFMYGEHHTCNKLIISLKFQNRKTTEIVYSTIYLKDYSGIGSSEIFYEDENISSYKSSTRDWILKGLNYNCR